MQTEPQVVDLDGASAVVVPDWHSYYNMLGSYCGTRKFEDVLPKGADLYILCNDAQRAEEVLAELLKYPFHVAQDIATGRTPTYGDTARRLRDAGHAVACDTRGPACDDERLKAIYPPPEGPMIDFEWVPKEKRYRMRCLSTGRDGSTSSQRIVLRDGPSWDEHILKGYRRFAKKTTPQAKLTCLPHVASILSRVDCHGAHRLALWRRELEKAGVDQHQDVAPLLISADTITRPGELLWLEIKGVRGSYLLWSRCQYHGSTSIVDRLLSLKASIPQTMITGMVGMDASRIWGDDDLSTMTVRRVGSNGDASFVLDGDVAPLPTPHPATADENDAASRIPSLEFPQNMMIEGVVLTLMRGLPASVRLHIYSTLLAKEDAKIDISPWLDSHTNPIVLIRDRTIIRHHSSGYFSTTSGISL